MQPRFWLVRKFTFSPFDWLIFLGPYIKVSRSCLEALRILNTFVCSSIYSGLFSPAFLFKLKPRGCCGEMSRRTTAFGCLFLLTFVTLALPSPLRYDDSSLENGVYPEGISSFIHTASRKSLRENAQHGKGSSLSFNNFECEACKVMTGFIQKLFLLNSTEEFIAKEARFLCIKLKIEDTRVCTGIIPEFKNEVLSVFDKFALSPEEVCGVIFGPSCGKVRDEYPSWNVTFPDTKKPPVVSIPSPKVSNICSKRCIQYNLSI